MFIKKQFDKSIHQDKLKNNSIICIIKAITSTIRQKNHTIKLS